MAIPAVDSETNQAVLNSGVLSGCVGRMPGVGVVSEEVLYVLMCLAARLKQYKIRGGRPGRFSIGCQTLINSDK